MGTTARRASYPPTYVILIFPISTPLIHAVVPPATEYATASIQTEYTARDAAVQALPATSSRSTQAQPSCADQLVQAQPLWTNQLVQVQPSCAHQPVQAVPRTAFASSQATEPVVPPRGTSSSGIQTDLIIESPITVKETDISHSRPVEPMTPISSQRDQEEEQDEVRTCPPLRGSR